MRLQTGFSIWFISLSSVLARNKTLRFSCFAYDLPSLIKIIPQEFSLTVHGLIVGRPPIEFDGMLVSQETFVASRIPF